MPNHRPEPPVDPVPPRRGGRAYVVKERAFTLSLTASEWIVKLVTDDVDPIDFAFLAYDLAPEAVLLARCTVRIAQRAATRWRQRIRH